MKKEMVGSIQPVKKSNNNLIFIIIVILLLLLVISILVYLGYDYLNKKIEQNKTEQNDSYVNDAVPIDNSKPGDTSNPKTSICRDGKCNGTENYTNCPKDCKRPKEGSGGSGGDTDGGCTPNCAGKQCGSNGCGGSCGTCNAGYECNSTGNCAPIPCINDYGCNSSGISCSWNTPYNCTNTDVDICLERINLTACSSGWQCINGTGCEEIRNCETNADCSNLINICSYGVCNSTGKCEVRFNQTADLCRAAVGACGAAEYCTRNSAECPIDSNLSGNICRASAGICDAVEKCTGDSESCPNNAYNLTLDTCRASAGECDEQEVCSGTINCPADLSKPDGTACTGGTCLAGTCVLSTCAGTDISCGIYPACTNCKLLNECNGDKNMTYYCSGASCASASYNCNDCTCNCGGYNIVESLSNGNCEDGKDNNCDGLTDNSDPGCALTDWRIQKITDLEFQTTEPIIVMKDEKPNVIYKTNGKLFYIYRNEESWSNPELIALDCGGSFDVKLDNSGQINIIYSSTSGDLKYSKKVGNSWITNSVPSANGFYSSFVISNENILNLVYVTNSQRGYYTKLNLTSGIWTVPIDIIGRSDLVSISIDLDSLGNSHIAYDTSWNGVGYDSYYTNNIGGVWSTPEKLGPGPDGKYLEESPIIYLDSSNNLYIFLTRPDSLPYPITPGCFSHRIYVLKKENYAWGEMKYLFNGMRFANGEISEDSSNNLHIANCAHYTKINFTDILIGPEVFPGANFNNPSEKVGLFPSIAINSSGDINIAYIWDNQFNIELRLITKHESTGAASINPFSSLFSWIKYFFNKFLD